ncbi:MAG: glutamine synthetase [Saprospirales bacterium]|nr:glutamine synthetase [Saprospirales bacterium]
MTDREILLNPNKLVRHLKKPASRFTREDILQFIDDYGIELLNFMYIGEDGKFRTLNFVITSKEQVDAILSTGERVDGWGLFSYIHAQRTDLYVIPRYKTAFVDPFSEIPALNILCSFYTSEGLPLESAPEYILRKAHSDFEKQTGYRLKAMGELEYYVSGEGSDLYPTQNQEGYHNSRPFSNWERLRIEAMQLIAQSGGKIKYGHSEVGFFKTGNRAYEQHEIEFAPVGVEDAADHLIIGKWILRMLGQKYGVQISFAPKIAVGHAGSGLHIHMLLEKDGENKMIENGALSVAARKMIAGLLEFAAPLTAFGNSVPVSYLRLVPHQEAPTMICWGDNTRSVLVRAPLGWVSQNSMIRDANPQQTGELAAISGKQTIEFRSPDGSADLYHLLAGLLIAIKNGFRDEQALEKTERLYSNVNIFDVARKDFLAGLDHLPQSCWESAESLEKHRKIFEADGVFPAGTIDRFIGYLKDFGDKGLSERLYGKHEEIEKLVEKYIHCA